MGREVIFHALCLAHKKNFVWIEVALQSEFRVCHSHKILGSTKINVQLHRLKHLSTYELSKEVNFKGWKVQSWIGALKSWSTTFRIVTAHNFTLRAYIENELHSCLFVCSLLLFFLQPSSAPKLLRLAVLSKQLYSVFTFF